MSDRTNVIQVAFYVNRSDWERIKRAASREERSVSEWVRRSVLSQMSRREKQDAKETQGETASQP